MRFFLILSALLTLTPATYGSFPTKVLPIFKAKCIRCHGEKRAKADLRLDSLNGLNKGGESGPVIVPGHPSKSKLFELITSGEMPPGKEDRLSQSEIEAIEKWLLSQKPTAVTQNRIIPLMLLRCTVCHGAHRKEAGLDLRTRAGMLKGGKSGPGFVPGKPEQSLILKKIHSGAMPPRRQVVAVSVKPMEKHEIDLLTQWIQNGAPEVPRKQPKMQIPESDRKFWSFYPPKAVSIPRRGGEVVNPIDAFLLEKMEAKGLSFSPKANRLTLLRRAYLDLLGLPPSLEEIERYENDTSANAYERMIDRLMASPKYGERWGRHWLDLSGYSDSEGVQNSDKLRPHAWRYRDYVIQAFNADKPYDRFIQEQIAGDELVDFRQKKAITKEVYDSLVATGFLRMAIDGTFANITNFVPDRLAMIAREVEVLTSAVMGLTMKCARCHNHKFDPIPQRDYYRLLAIFKPALDQHNWLSPQRSSGKPGTKDRYLPHVTEEERKAWKAAKKKGELLIRALWSRKEPSPTYVLRRGNYLTPGEQVQPGPPAVLTNGIPVTFSIQSVKTRLAFAQWLTRADHPLTARVIVNRLWHHHFGQGLVRTLDNFGKSGEKPSHSELLDWLAQEMTRKRWSLKAMHRLMMTSRAYKQSSQVSPQLRKIDPHNRLLACMPLRRMDAEVIRDTLISLAGRLNDRPFGPADAVEVRADGLVTSKGSAEGWRRSIYVLQRRAQIPTILESFDLPGMSPNCVERRQSNVVLQPLYLLNNGLVDQWAEAFAQRLDAVSGTDPSRKIEMAFLLTCTRRPLPAETKLCLETLDKLTKKWSKTLKPEQAVQRAWKNICRALFSSAELLYID